MALCKPTEMSELAAQGQPLLGLDMGSKTIGLALSDRTWLVASPLSVLRRTKFTKDAGELVKIIGEHGVSGLVLGLPISMDGGEGPACQSVRSFAGNFLKRFDLPLAFWDERLSTAAVTRTLLEADASRKRRAEVVDKMAAAYILQGFLDSLKTRTSSLP